MHVLIKACQLPSTIPEFAKDSNISLCDSSDIDVLQEIDKLYLLS